MLPQNDPFSQKEPPGREKRRTVTWKRSLIVFVALVMTLVSSSFFLIKTHAAGGSGETSNLSNRYLGAQNDVFPGRVYRGDSRSPDDVFANGFTAQGTDYDLERHLDGGDLNSQSGYVSTTGTLSQAVDFAGVNGKISLQDISDKANCSTDQGFFYTYIPKIGQFLLGYCKALMARRVVLGRTYVYEIDPAYAQNAFYVPTAIRANTALYNANVAEDEWAYVDRIPPEAIVGVHLYQWTDDINADGEVGANPTFDDLHQFVPNPNYGGTTGRNPHYNPGNDTRSGWTFDTDPDLPDASCPTNPHVYQHCS
jgi:Pertussis toxin, subunit 1